MEGRERSAEFEAAGLLDGLDGTDREARLQLLRDLAADGYSLDDLRGAIAENRLALLPVERALAGELRYTPREVADMAGVPLDFVLDMRQAVGVARPDPDAREFDEQDLASARAFARLREAGLPEEGLLEVTRVLGTGLARTAEAARMLLARQLVESGANEHELAISNAAAARELLPLMTPLMEHTLRLHLRDQVRNEQFGQHELSEAASPNLRQLFVGFADMVGFTRLGERVDVIELGGLVTRLNELSLEVARPPARLVKTIGDAAMFVSPTAEPLVESLLDLVEHAEAEPESFPRLRAGLAAGVALSRGGDWYGPPVNLASRVTGVARASSALATKEVRDAVPDRYAWSEAGLWKLKGFKRRVPLFRVRRRGDAAPAT